MRLVANGNLLVLRGSAQQKIRLPLLNPNQASLAGRIVRSRVTVPANWQPAASGAHVKHSLTYDLNLLELWKL